MNVIVAAIRKKKLWEIRLQLFETYGNNPLLAHTFRRLGPTWQNREMLDAQLNILRWKKGLPSEPPEDMSFAEEMIPLPQAKPDESQNPAALYPRAVEEAIAIRAKAINAREKAGRKLTQLAQELSKTERAELVQEQKEQHAIVAAQTRKIQFWRETGKVLKPGQLTERETLEKEWRSLVGNMSKFKLNVKNAESEEDRVKHQAILQEKQARQEELRLILGKQKRKNPRRK